MAANIKWYNVHSYMYFRKSGFMTLLWRDIDADLLADNIYLVLGGYQVNPQVMDYHTNYYTIRDITVLGTRPPGKSG